ncbi:hypothetical protein [Shewanella litorisediminis]|uniref:Phosphate ABC transporter substrate-binding protein n=1 Tax=Shewanella litorisediminis TaxID=1173586 RepID=A0ABX7G4W3_9GAMM|nr:hypothetical protein [Shewanella litorisediminis]MCL2917915.1 hypothetical protein [Shewanella litorisediminis]QRH02350.1 hypothetical protein JQC75_02690 [Shewanella litorisediminis]
MKLLIISLIAWLLAHSPVRADDALYVVVNATNGIERLSHHEVVDIFMGRDSTFPDGKDVTVFDNSSDIDTRALFYRQLVNRSLAQVSSYWARLQFSARVTQPRKIDQSSTLLELMNRTPSGITFVRSADLDPALKVVYKFDP